MNQYAGVLIPGPCGAYLSVYHIKPKAWRFPGGKPKDGETMMGAAARELKEELGIEVLDLRYLRTITHGADGDTWTGTWFVCHRFCGVPRVQEPHKHGGLQWLTVDMLQRLDTHPEYEVALDFEQDPV